MGPRRKWAVLATPRDGWFVSFMRSLLNQNYGICMTAFRKPQHMDKSATNILPFGGTRVI